MLIDFHAIEFYNRDSFDEMIKKRGNKPMLISWLHFDGFSQAIIERDSFDKTT